MEKGPTHAAWFSGNGSAPERTVRWRTPVAPASWRMIPHPTRCICRSPRSLCTANRESSPTNFVKQQTCVHKETVDVLRPAVPCAPKSFAAGCVMSGSSRLNVAQTPAQRSPVSQPELTDFMTASTAHMCSSSLSLLLRPPRPRSRFAFTSVAVSVSVPMPVPVSSSTAVSSSVHHGIVWRCKDHFVFQHAPNSQLYGSEMLDTKTDLQNLIFCTQRCGQHFREGKVYRRLGSGVELCGKALTQRTFHLGYVAVRHS